MFIFQNIKNLLYMYKKGLFIFRRDFRIKDNTGLNFMIKNCNHFICVFIFTPE